MKTFLVADTHFGHQGVCRFLREDGSKLRPWDNYADMDRELVARWNAKVGPKDKVYHLGDVLINRRAFGVLNELNGDKVLIRGNHDIFKDAEYTPFFRSIRGSHVLNNMLLTHIPVHPDSMGRFTVNLHGHLHYRSVMLGDTPDPRYLCLSVEHTDYAPIDFNEVLSRVAQR